MLGDPKTRYDDAQIFPDIQRFILEYIQKLDTILINLKKAGATVSKDKL